MQFEFATPAHIIFGSGTLVKAAPIAASFGKRVLLITGSSPERAQPLADLLTTQKMDVTPYSITGEPTIACIEEGTALARKQQCEVIVGMGGGSVIDAAKAISLLAVHHGSVHDYIEIIGKGMPFIQPALPCIALPTTAGTGTEVTRNAVITAPEQHIKASLRSVFMTPRYAIVDPITTCSLPASITAATGLDALTQCIEAFVSCKATPITDSLCQEGIIRAARSLVSACTHGDDLFAREDMAYASLVSGIALANAGLGAVHGFAAVIGGACAIPHGNVCALLLPAVFGINVKALAERFPDSPSLDKFTTIARLLTGDPHATQNDALLWIRETIASLPLPSVATFAVSREILPSLVPLAARASSMKGNPIELTTAELEEILAVTFT